MEYILIVLFLQSFATCVFSHEELLTVQFNGQDDLVLKRGDNPCDALKRYCSTRADSCFNEKHSSLTTQLANNWTIARQLDLQLDRHLFINCEQSENDGKVCSIENNAMLFHTRVGFIQELLMQLEMVPQGDTEAMEAFEFASNQVKFTSQEKLELYSQAILLHPNSRLIVSQLGISLALLGFNHLADQLFQNAVSRGLWPHLLQRPEWNYIPGLTAKPWHDIDNFAFIPHLEAGYGDIKEELLYNMRERKHIFSGEQENRNTFSGGDWKAFQLKDGIGNDGYTQHALQYFPKTVQRLKNCKEDFILVKFSAIKPGTHIQPHTGPSNDRLRSHLTLIHSGGAKIRCGSEWRTWEEGKAIILDSSWEHEVVHAGDELRVVLILDIWHPEVPVKDRVL